MMYSAAVFAFAFAGSAFLVSVIKRLWDDNRLDAMLYVAFLLFLWAHFISQ